MVAAFGDLGTVCGGGVPAPGEGEIERAWTTLRASRAQHRLTGGEPERSAGVYVQDDIVFGRLFSSSDVSLGKFERARRWLAIHGTHPQQARAHESQFPQSQRSPREFPPEGCLLSILVSPYVEQEDWGRVLEFRGRVNEDEGQLFVFTKNGKPQTKCRSIGDRKRQVGKRCRWKFRFRCTVLSEGGDMVALLVVF